MNLPRSVYAENEIKYLEATLKQSAHVQNPAQEEEAGSKNSRPGDQVTDRLESVAVLFKGIFAALTQSITLNSVL